MQSLLSAAFYVLFKEMGFPQFVHPGQADAAQYRQGHPSHPACILCGSGLH